MDLIVAVYDDWGIGADGTQPVALRADRKFFRETTRGAAVIVGRRTVEDFPGGKPLPGRQNILISRSLKQMPAFTVCAAPEEAAAVVEAGRPVFVIGGGSNYRQMLPMCRRAYITKVHATPGSDTFFPDLDEDPAWGQPEVLESGEEDGIAYEILLYTRK